jgi:hypothetical protein
MEFILNTQQKLLQTVADTLQLNNNQLTLFQMDRLRISQLLPLNMEAEVNTLPHSPLTHQDTQKVTLI